MLQKVNTMPEVTEDWFQFDDEEEEGSDNQESQDFEEEAHAKLLADVQGITKKSRKQVSNASKRCAASGSSGVNIGSLTKQLKPEHKLAPPSSKAHEKRLARKRGFEEISEAVNKWETVINKQRRAEQVKFPLQDESISIFQTDKKYKPKIKTNLEKELYELLEETPLLKPKEETAEEKAVREAMSLEEVKERNQERWRLRKLMTKMGKKAFLRNKVKSKKFHRISKKEKIRKQTKNLEALKQHKPEEALEKMKELEKIRMEERMSLKHKKSKWAVSLQTRAKTDKNALAALQENARLHRELREKIQSAEEKTEESDEADESDESDEEAEVENSTPAPGVADKSYLKMKEFWTKYNKGQEELVKDKLAENKNKRLLSKMSKDKAAIEEARQIVQSKLSDSRSSNTKISEDTKISEYTFSAMDKTVEPMDEVAERRQNYEDFDNMPSNDYIDLASVAMTNVKENVNQSINGTGVSVELDNTKFVEIDMHQKLQTFGNFTNDDLNDEDEDEIKDDSGLGELNAEDDFALEEFKREKAAVEDANTPKDLCTFLPGWGSWGGPNIKPSEKKIKKFTDKAPAKPKSKFDKSNVIYDEKADMHENIRNRMVNQLPYPFRSVKDWEASLQGAVGRTFVPELVHRNMIKPSVVTSMGTVIKPMDETQLMEMPEVKKAVNIKMRGLKEDQNKEVKKKKAPKLVDVGTERKRKFTRKSAD